jgi:cytochrome P450
MIELVDDRLHTWHIGQVLDLAKEMKELALEVTGTLLFGLKSFPLAGQIAKVFQRWVDNYASVTFAAALPIERPLHSYEHLLEDAAELDKLFRVLLSFRRETLGDHDRDLLAILLRNHDNGLLSEDEVIGEVHTLINAAYQTTAGALTWTLFLLAQHPAAAQALVEELESCARLPGSCSFLDCVIKESLRIFPPVIYTIRQSRRPVSIGNFALPDGTMVILSFYVTHHMPSLFAEPERFCPERWRRLIASPYAYFPFGGGPRLCLGAAFAQQMLRVAIAAIMRRFRLTVVPASRVNRHGGLTLGLEQGLPVSLSPADGLFSTSPVFGNVHEMVQLPELERQARAA